MLVGYSNRGCNLLEYSFNPLGSASIQYGFGLDRIEGSYPTYFEFSVPLF